MKTCHFNFYHLPDTMSICTISLLFDPELPLKYTNRDERFIHSMPFML